MPASALSPVELHVPDGAWSSHDASCEHADTRLWALLTIGGVPFHLDAFEVEHTAGQRVTNPAWQDTVDLVLAGHDQTEAVETLTIRGRHYVVVAHPFTAP